MSRTYKINNYTNEDYEDYKEIVLQEGLKGLPLQNVLSLVMSSSRAYKNNIELSNKLLLHFGGLEGILSASIDDLIAFGVRKSKMFQILAISELIKRYNSLRSSREDIQIRCAQDVANCVMNEMSALDQEVLKVIFLNTKNIVIGTKDIFKGTLDSSIVHPREIFKPAISKSCASIIICHNHPSGDPTPSEEDINITLRIYKCGKLLGIKMLDHIIIGKNKYVSLKDRKVV